MTKKPIHVLVVDDHALVRAGIRAFLQSHGKAEVIAEAGDGAEALDLLKQHRPDVVLMDISMPHMDGLHAAARMAKEFPYVRIIVLSAYSDSGHVQKAVRAGVAGYVVKDRVEDLVPAVKAVAEGRTFFSSAVLQFVKRGAVRAKERLTPRQREILQLIAEGHITKEIAEKLNISVKTAETHRTQLMERLDIHEVAGLVRYAIRVGLVRSDK
jgi:DNA-binding NarL/FixJ family response regulator